MGQSPRLAQRNVAIVSDESWRRGPAKPGRTFMAMAPGKIGSRRSPLASRDASPAPSVTPDMFDSGSTPRIMKETSPVNRREEKEEGGNGTKGGGREEGRGIKKGGKKESG